jgi:16S rRNA (guanine527-N7)-methyltransferase
VIGRIVPVRVSSDSVINELWNDLARAAGRELSDGQHEKLVRYLDLLLAANARMNLTRITDRAAAEVQHVGDALTLLPHLPKDTPGLSIADVGTGGGVPGIPLAIALPDARVTLIESTKKKAAFLSEAIAQLKLSNVAVLAGRAEEVGAPGAPTRESFDVAVARAVATMDWLAEWCLPLVKKGGRVLAMKGQRIAEELPAAAKAIKLLGGGEPRVHTVELPGTEHRVIVEIPKVLRTDKRLPRDPTVAKGKALG